MSSIFARRALLRAMPRARSISNTTSELMKTDYREKQAALMSHAAETATLWRRISFYVFIPGIVVAALWVRNLEEEHNSHLDHLIEENDGHLPQPPAYDYLNRRASGPYPWGMNSLFFNPKINKDMSEAAEE